MLKVEYASLFLFAVSTFANATCCEEKERSTSYLDIAIDLISKAKYSMPGSDGEKECPKVKECPEVKQCPEIIATDCADWYARGFNKTGSYKIRPINRLTSNKFLTVFCDMDSAGGGWTVIQRRRNFGKPDDYFYRDWSSYEKGFGDVYEDFWLGNDNIFALTNQKPYSTLVESRDLQSRYSVSYDFWEDDDLNKYMLHISNYSGNADDGMMYRKNFTTKDQDDFKSNCALKFKGAWWYFKCNSAIHAKEDGINWKKMRSSNRTSLIRTEMKIRPTNFLNLFAKQKE